MEKEIMNYESPLVEVMDVEVEKGFAASKGTVGGMGDIQLPGMVEGDTSGWDF